MATTRPGSPNPTGTQSEPKTAAPTSDDHLAERRRRRRFIGLSYTLGVLILGTNLPTPLYPVYSHEYGFPPLVVTLIFATYAAVLIPSLLIGGPLSDIVGHRKVLVPALLAAAVGTGLFAAASGTGWLFAARAAQGLAIGAASGAVTAALVATAPGGNTRRASLLASAMTVAGGGGGPVVAGLLAQYAPAPQLLVYLVELVLLVPALLVVATLPATMGRTTDGAGGRWRPRAPHVPHGIRRAFARAAATTFLSWAVAALFLALVPSYASELLGTSNLALTGAIAGLILLTAALIQVLLVGWSVPRARATGLGLLAVGLLGLVMSGLIGSIWVLVVAALVAGAGQGLAFMAAVHETNQIAPADRRGEVLSAFYVATYTGVGLPVIGVGLLTTIIGLPAAVNAFAAVVGPSCLILLLLTHTRGLGREATTPLES